MWYTKQVPKRYNAEWSSPVARRAHNPKVVGSNPASATKKKVGMFVNHKHTNFFIIKQVGIVFSF